MFTRDGLILKFSKYSRYHQNIYNQIVHFITIPLIIHTLMCILSYAQLETFDNVYGGHIISVHAGIIILIASMIIYPSIDVPSGLVLVIYMVISYLCANVYYYYVPLAYYTKLGIVIGVHVVSWIVQIAGHYVFEKNKPAFTNGCQAFVDAVLIAPIFVFLEIMFLCGYNKSLQREIEIRHLTDVYTITADYYDQPDQPEQRLIINASGKNYATIS